MRNPSAIMAVIRKDLLLLMRDKMNLFFTLVFPIMIGLLFGSMFSSGGQEMRLNIAVVDQDHSSSSETFVRNLKGTEGINVQEIESVDQGRDLVRHGKKTAVIVLPKGYGSSTTGMFSGDPPRIEGFVDPSQQATQGLLIGRLTELAFRGMVNRFTDPAMAKDFTRQTRESIQKTDGLNLLQKAALSTLLNSVDSVTDANNTGTASNDNQDSAAGTFVPIKIDLQSVATESSEKFKGLKSSFQLSFPSAISWALLGAVSAFAASFVAERTQGTYIRLVTSPLSPFAVLIGKCGACFITSIVASVLLILVMSFRGLPGNVPLLAIAIVSASLGFTGLMSLIAVLVRSEEGASGMARGALIMLAMIGGGSMPLAFMPQWMVQASSISPFKWAILAVEGAVWRGFSLQEMFLPCGILIGIGAITFASAWLIFSRQLSAGRT